REQLAIALVPGWNHALDLFLRDGLDAFQMQWQALDLLASLPVRVLAGEGTVLDGIAQGIDAHGRLQVVVDGKLCSFSSAEVSVRPA
ncbi:MAG: biotin--[acetyl-CoA-carboxylase] synthetase, partial [Gammaproteobacteria bacterium]|nr:biotin--[acetyl-CoA-carboxylase] synthetase [Gammaproteobacteria bacterium]